MATYTKNYKLKKPDYEDYYDIRDINRNMDVIENVLMEIENKESGTGNGDSYDDSDLQERVSSLENGLEDFATKEYVAEEIAKIEITGGGGTGVGGTYDDSDLQKRVGAIESDYTTADEVVEVITTAIAEKVDEATLSQYVKMTDFTTSQASQNNSISSNQEDITALNSEMNVVDTRLDNAEKLVALMQVDDVLTPYDLIITTQLQFEELYQSEDWLGATRVAFVGGRFIRNDGAGLLIPLTVKQIDCLGGAVIVIDEYDAITNGTAAVVGYNELPEDNDYRADLQIEVYVKEITLTSTLMVLCNFKNAVFRNSLIDRTQETKGELLTSVFVRVGENITLIDCTQNIYYGNANVQYPAFVHSCNGFELINCTINGRGTSFFTGSYSKMCSSCTNIRGCSINFYSEISGMRCVLIHNTNVASHSFFRKTGMLEGFSGSVTTELSVGTNTYIDTGTCFQTPLEV